jgi:hypothetical protein
VAEISIPRRKSVVMSKMEGKEEIFVALGMYIETINKDKDTVMLIAMNTSKPSGGIGMMIIMNIITTKIARTMSLEWEIKRNTELLPKEGASLLKKFFI